MSWETYIASRLLCLPCFGEFVWTLYLQNLKLRIRNQKAETPIKNQNQIFSKIHMISSMINQKQNQLQSIVSEKKTQKQWTRKDLTYTKKNSIPTKEEAETELLEVFLWFEMLPRGTLFLAKEAVGFPTFSDAWRLAKDEVVDDENDDRRLPFCVDIFQLFLFRKRVIAEENFGLGFLSESSFFLRVIILYFLGSEIGWFEFLKDLSRWSHSIIVRSVMWGPRNLFRILSSRGISYHCNQWKYDTLKFDVGGLVFSTDQVDLIGGLLYTKVTAGCIRFQVFLNSNFKRSQDLL